MPQPSFPDSEAARGSRPLTPGDVVVLHDRRHRRYRIVLKEGERFFTHLGAIDHDRLIGRDDGLAIETDKGHLMRALRPTFAEAVYDLPRQSQVIYPKDLAAILMLGDFYPGARCVEVGFGSGAASAAILRAVGPGGSLTTYEIREQVVVPSKANVAQLAPGADNHTVVVGDAYEMGIAERGVDRVLTDVPEPWRLLETAAIALRTGGVLTCYLPTVLQVHELALALKADPRWALVDTVEVLERPWHFAETSARPEHRMVGHTGFITTARRVEPLGIEAEGRGGRGDATRDEPGEDA
jgi:tRNA (adenine57-N1/adenine58-N1)-methyltransferase